MPYRQHGLWLGGGEVKTLRGDDVSNRLPVRALRRSIHFAVVVCFLSADVVAASITCRRVVDASRLWLRFPH